MNHDATKVRDLRAQKLFEFHGKIVGFGQRRAGVEPTMKRHLQFTADRLDHDIVRAERNPPRPQEISQCQPHFGPAGRLAVDSGNGVTDRLEVRNDACQARYSRTQLVLEFGSLAMGFLDAERAIDLKMHFDAALPLLVENADTVGAHAVTRRQHADRRRQFLGGLWDRLGMNNHVGTGQYRATAAAASSDI